MFRGGFAWPNTVQNMSGERQWKRKKIGSIPEYWSEMSRRSPGKKESLDSLTTREISLTRSCRNLIALIKWEISPVYWNRSFVQFREFKILFTWSGEPRSRGVSFFCFVSPRAWKQRKLTPLDRGPPLHVNKPLNSLNCTNYRFQ